MAARDDVDGVAARIARTSYGRLVATLASRSGDIAAAEDALCEALARALERWPRDGVPDNPEGWIVTASKRLLIDRARGAAIAHRARDDLALLDAERLGGGTGERGEPLLGLLFACAHPAIAEPDRAPLMLQAVLGLDAARIGSAFLVAPGTMGQRLTRAKAKIRAARVPFEVPDAGECAARAASVLDAVYVAHSLGWDDPCGADAGAGQLTREAIWLASLVAELLPGDGEAHGLLALMLFGEARRAARRDPSTGAFVPLTEQDVALWDGVMLRDAQTALAAAARVGASAPGRYQLEASIQAAHAARRAGGAVDREAVALLYAGLVTLSPTVGARTAASVALGEARGAEEGLAALDAIGASACGTYQPWWSARAHLLARLGRDEQAREAFATAAGLTEDPAVRAWLLGRGATLAGG